MLVFAASLPPSCTVKILPIFKNQAHMRDVVRCCPNHTVMDANTNGKRIREGAYWRRGYWRGGLLEMGLIGEGDY